MATRTAPKSADGNPSLFTKSQPVTHLCGCVVEGVVHTRACSNEHSEAFFATGRIPPVVEEKPPAAPQWDPSAVPTPPEKHRREEGTGWKECEVPGCTIPLCALPAIASPVAPTPAVQTAPPAPAAAAAPAVVPPVAPVPAAPAAQPRPAAPTPTRAAAPVQRAQGQQQATPGAGRMALPGQRAKPVDAKPRGFRMFLWGEKKIGKTEFVVDAGDVAFIPCETSPNVPEDRCFDQPFAWAEIEQAVRSFLTQPHAFSGICIDTADAATALLGDHVKEKAKGGAGSTKGAIKYLGDVGGGYQKSDEAMDEEWITLLALLDRVRDRGFNVFLIGHCKKGKFNNPDGPDYDIWEPTLPPKVAGRIVGWCDIVGFAKKDATVEKQGKFGRAKAATTGAHMLYLQQERATFVAGNRYGLPPSMPLEYARFAAAMQQRSTSEMDGMIAAIKARVALLPPGHKVQTMREGKAVEVDVAAWTLAAVENNPTVGKLMKLDSSLRAMIAELGIDENPEDGDGKGEA